MKRPTGRKPLGGDDERVWAHAAQSIEPLKPRKSRVHPALEKLVGDKTPTTGETKPVARPHQGATAAAKHGFATRPPPGRALKPSPIAVVDRKTARKIRSGQVDIEARVDLHGMRQDEAHDALIAFLRRSCSRGLRWVLVITGKGKAAAGDRTFEHSDLRERGVLKRNVPRWLNEPELSALIISYKEAAIRHGGEGALYVHLRKARGP